MVIVLEKNNCGTATALGNSEFACMRMFESETMIERQVGFSILLHVGQLQTLCLVSYKEKYVC